MSSSECPDCMGRSYQHVVPCGTKLKHVVPEFQSMQTWVFQYFRRMFSGQPGAIACSDAQVDGLDVTIQSRVAAMGNPPYGGPGRLPAPA